MTKPPNTHSRLVDTIGRLIARRKIGQDGLLPREDDLVARFGVSRTIVREATKTLQALGLVVTRPRIGSKIQPITQWRLLDPQVMSWLSEAELTSELARDLVDLRSMVEPAAAAIAAERATPQNIASLNAALAMMRSANNTTRRRKADTAFHEAILFASQNMLLLQLRPVLHAVLEGFYSHSMHDDARFQWSIVQHERVAEAIAEKDSEAARLAMMTLIKDASSFIEEQMADMNDRKPARAKAKGGSSPGHLDQGEDS